MLKRLLFLFVVERVGFYIYRELSMIKPRKEVKEIIDELHSYTIQKTK